MRSHWKTIWHKRPFQMTPDELAEYERVKGTGRWKEFDARQSRKLRRKTRAAIIKANRIIKKVKPMPVDEARAYWDSMPILGQEGSR
jgi:hypothetical protein